MIQLLQSVYMSIAELGWFAIALLIALVVFGAQAAWYAIDVHLDADVRRNYDDLVGAQSKNMKSQAERIEQSMRKVLEEHRDHQSPRKRDEET